MHKLTAIRQQIERMQQAKDEQKQQKPHERPETRALFPIWQNRTCRKILQNLNP